jgi:hypothetical protein
MPTSSAVPDTGPAAPSAADDAAAARARRARENGARSRGPVTPEGKARASRNALRHGLAARVHLVVEPEGDAAFQGLGTRLLAELAPAGEVETFLVARLAAAMWKTGRAERLEARAFAAGPEPDPRHLALALRYHGSASRELFRTLRELKDLRRGTLQSPAISPLPPAAGKGRGEGDLPSPPAADEPAEPLPTTLVAWGGARPAPEPATAPGFAYTLRHPVDPLLPAPPAVLRRNEPTTAPTRPPEAAVLHERFPPATDVLVDRPDEPGERCVPQAPNEPEVAPARFILHERFPLAAASRVAALPNEPEAPGSPLARAARSEPGVALAHPSETAVLHERFPPEALGLLANLQHEPGTAPGCQPPGLDSHERIPPEAAGVTAGLPNEPDEPPASRLPRHRPDLFCRLWGVEPSPPDEPLGLPAWVPLPADRPTRADGAPPRNEPAALATTACTSPRSPATGEDRAVGSSGPPGHPAPHRPVRHGRHAPGRRARRRARHARSQAPASSALHSSQD